MLFHNEPIIRDGEVVSYLTSANYGHHVGSAVGLGYIPSKGETKEELMKSNYEIDIAGEIVKASVSFEALYDPKAERVKM